MALYNLEWVKLKPREHPRRRATQWASRCLEFPAGHLKFRSYRWLIPHWAHPLALIADGLLPPEDTRQIAVVSPGKGIQQALVELDDGHE